MFTAAELQAQLSEMGVLPTDTVMLHTSMKAIGEVENGADGLIDAFCGYLNKGLLLIPTHTWDSVGPENPVYDVKNSVPCIGVLPCVAAKRTDGVRSLHPTHSVWAHGERAAEYIKGEETATTPAPPDGCWGQLTDEKAKILLIGVGNNRNTYIHSLDERFDIPDRLREPPYETVIKAADGTVYKGLMHGHRCSKCGDVSRFYPNFDKAFDFLGVQKSGVLGNAQVKLVDAEKCARAVKMLWAKAEYDLCAGEREIPEKYYITEKI